MWTTLLLPLLAVSVEAIWPLPSQYQHGDAILWIKQGEFSVAYNAPGQVSHSSLLGHWPLFFTHQAQQPHRRHGSGSDTPPNIASAIDRTTDTLFNKNFVPWKFHPRLSNFEPALDSSSVFVKSVTLQQHHPDPSYNASGTVDESYILDMTRDGNVKISANSSVGLTYGLTSFTQLFYKHSSNGNVYTDKAPVLIADAPKFKWRGLNVDTSRTFKPMADMYRTVDALAYNKMNRLHWHITDAQSWPLEIPSMPELADKGAYVAFQKYSPDDVKGLQHYGNMLGVDVVVEIDNPGHTSSIWYSHPDLIAAFNEQPDWTTYSAEPPSGTLKLNSTKVYDFLDKLLKDLLPRLKQGSGYFHLGGDEINANAYNLDDTVKTNDTKVIQGLLQKYTDRNMKQVESYGLTPLVWEEMLLQWNLTLPKNTIVQTWQSDEAVLDTVKKGYQALVGNYNFWYLDCGKGQWLDFSPKNAAGFWPFNDYCAPVHNWRVMYS